MGFFLWEQALYYHIGFMINAIQIVGFWVVAFPRYLLCYVSLMFFLLSIIVFLDICSSVVKSRSRFLSLVLVDYMSLWIYKFFYMVSEQNCFLGWDFVEKLWEFLCKSFRNKLHIWIPWENIPKFKKQIGWIRVWMREISLI